MHLAYELDRLIMPLQTAEKSIPEAIIGKHRTSKYFETNFLEGEMLGRSFFGFPGPLENATGDGLAFMHQVGMAYTYANSPQIKSALKELQEHPIPLFPLEGCAVKIDAESDEETLDKVREAIAKAALEEGAARALLTGEQQQALLTAESAFAAAEVVGLAAQDKARASAAVPLTGDAVKDAELRAVYEADLAAFNIANEAYIKAEAELAAKRGTALNKAIADQKALNAQLEALSGTTEVIVIHLSDDLTGI
jgi:hypothetical protein